MNSQDAQKNAAGFPSGKFIRAKLLAALLLYLGASPLFLLPGAFLLPESQVLAILLPLAALALTLGAGLLPGKRRRIGFLLAILLQAALCAWLLMPFHFPAVLLFLPCLFIMLLFMPALPRAPYMEWPVSLLIYGAVLHLAGQVLKNQPMFAAAGGTLSLFFTAYLLICPFVFNRYALFDAARADTAPPVKLLSRNRRLIAATGLIALLAANWKSFESAALAAWAFVKSALASLLYWLSMLLPDMTSTGGQGASQGFDAMELGGEAEPGLFWVILEKALAVLAVIAAAALLLYGLYHLFRLAKKALKKILDRLKDYSRAIGEGYVDKTENLFDWSEAVEAARARWADFQKRHQRPPDFNKLSPSEKVRWVYALLIRHISPEPSLTARETLQSAKLALPPKEAQQMASLYEKARYSSHPVTAEEAEAMRRSAGV